MWTNPSIPTKPNIPPFIPCINTSTDTSINCKNSDTSHVSHDCDDTISCQLIKIRSANLNNSVTGKFDSLKSMISGGMINVMIMVESKLDGSFPTSMFLIEGYCVPFRQDRSKFRGGIFDSCKRGYSMRLFVELNFRKSRLLLLGTCHPPNQKENY